MQAMCLQPNSVIAPRDKGYHLFDSSHARLRRLTASQGAVMAAKGRPERAATPEVWTLSKFAGLVRTGQNHIDTELSSRFLKEQTHG